MKLRMQANSIRLRLKKGEVESLVKTGSVEEKIIFGGGLGEAFQYALKTSDDTSVPQAIFKNNGVLVQVPVEMAQHWASSDEVGIESFQKAGENDQLHILIEKDFACLNGPPEQNVDTFPNPLAATKC